MGGKKRDFGTGYVGPKHNLTSPAAEERVAKLIEKLEAAERRIDAKIREANGATSSLHRTLKELNTALSRAETAVVELLNAEYEEIVREGAENALQTIGTASNIAINEAAKKVRSEFEQLRNMLMGIVDANGRPLPGPHLKEQIAGVLVELAKDPELGGQISG